MPADYAGIVAFFEKTVLERKSPYSALVKTADKLKEYVPNEINRLKAAYALCGEQWPADVLSFAIGTHIADIDHAREKARHNRHDAAAGHVAELRRRAERIKEESAALEQEMRELNAGLARVESTLRGKQADLASLNEQIQLADNDANAMCFVDQAAENIKSDLLAKKVILGLP
jgi:septal ring factor EnvC (AmiA/AmiB activator)